MHAHRQPCTRTRAQNAASGFSVLIGLFVMRAAVFVFSFRVGGERRGTAAKHTLTHTHGEGCVGGCNWTETTCRLITDQHVIFLLFVICLFYVSMILSFHLLLFWGLLVFQHPPTHTSVINAPLGPSVRPCIRDTVSLFFSFFFQSTSTCLIFSSKKH